MYFLFFFTFGSYMFISIYVQTTLKDNNLISDPEKCCLTIKIEKKKVV